MWNTPEGDRRLTGAEANLVRLALAIMVDQLSDNLRCGAGEDELWDSGVTMYDELTPNQQLTVIRQVAEHLLHDTPDTLELTAVNEAAAYAIFATVLSQIEIEVDMARDPLADALDIKPDLGFGRDWRTYWRRHTLASLRETLASADADLDTDDGDSPLVLPEAECEDLGVWSEWIERLADRILWDRDFEMSESFLDTDPAKATLMKQVLGIPRDYYTAIAEEPGADETEALLESLRKLTEHEADF
ncbi:hypothetical protein [Candidatus Laterigemmans baculatus]|uniref:hypothetical protein n=1 Tax=Candidatus Laterigemmans baculatus TaxID=2770505 RepID=UPI0013D8E3F6|nr:hypothetical protein [Candidatus Laterigemmans baculatus]